MDPVLGGYMWASEIASRESNAFKPCEAHELEGSAVKDKQKKDDLQKYKAELCSWPTYLRASSWVVTIRVYRTT